MDQDHKALLGKCYSAALMELRNLHDEEFRYLLSEQYEKHGVKIKMRRGRISSSRITTE